MLMHYLGCAIGDIEQLIEQTHKDIDAIKIAKHDDIFERTQVKNQLIHSFEAHKVALDNELRKCLEEKKGSSLEELLDPEQKALLTHMKSRLLELRSCNRIYAKYAISISQFYTTLIDTMFPQDGQGYQRAQHKPATLFKARA